MSITEIIKQGDLVMAPLAGYSDHFFRKLMYALGAQVTFTEMISADGLIRNEKRTIKYLDNVSQEPATGVQLFGSKPMTMAYAAEIALKFGARMIDINMGCPVKKVVRNGAGVALMKNPGQARRIISEVKKAINVPLLIKCRAGWDEQSLNFKEIATIAVGEGVDAITLHPRTRTQNYLVPARWDLIAELVQSVPVPVIGNGDIKSVEDALTMKRTTGCYAMMVGRAAVRNPAIFRQYTTFCESGAPVVPWQAAERWQLIDSHLTSLVFELGPKIGVIKFRKFLSFYLSGLENVSSIRPRIFLLEDETTMRSLLRDFLGQ